MQKTKISDKIIKVAIRLVPVLFFLFTIYFLPFLIKYSDITFELFIILLIIDLFLFNFHDSIGLSIVVLGLLSFVMLLMLGNNNFFIDGVESKINIINNLGIIFVCYFKLLSTLLIISYKIYKQKEPELVYKSRFFRRVQRVERIFYQGNIFLILFLYLAVVVVTIYGFGKVYEYITLYEEGQALHYTNSIIPNNDKTEVYGTRESVYFSSLTFYTVGYGDIIPVGYHLKLIVQLEVFIGNLLNVVLIGLLLNFVNSKITKDG
ncbi:ion channel [Alkalithermobacter paradoxus]|uniref:Potassium channel domain-containing protein n=1 Tax=Alkalithermobacter paradoxus TaxID=29349 RepID=A0A1V4I9T1_9FIRM|nr:hypothetical protein CLOTH_00330 [[Clostridium] thermoalcaliphilum]